MMVRGGQRPSVDVRRIHECFFGAAVAATNDVSAGATCNRRDEEAFGSSTHEGGWCVTVRATASMCGEGCEAQLCTRPTAGGVWV